MPEFNNNPDFAKFLFLSKTDQTLYQQLMAKDHSAIDAFPGLSDEEKKVLKIIDWENMTITMPTDITTNFKPNLAARICTESVGPTFATKSCTWLTNPSAFVMANEGNF